MKIKKILGGLTVLMLISVFAYAQFGEEEYLKKGLEYQKSNQIDEALEEYEKALLINPNNTDILFNAGQMYLRKQKWEKAIVKFKKIMTINPKDGESCYNMAIAYYYIGDITNAVKYNDESQRLGFRGTEEFHSWLEPYKYKEIDLEYQPVLDDTQKKVIIKIKGQITADTLLLNDTFRMLEPFANVSKKGIFERVEIKFISIDSNTGSSTGEWTLIWADSSKKIFTVRYRASSIGGTDILVTEKNP